MEITIDGVQYAPVNAKSNEGHEWVLIRSYASGVHFGILSEKRDAPQGLEVTLLQSRRIHKWVGAASLSQLAVDGIGNAAESRVSVELPSITISNVIEIIPLSTKSLDNLKNSPIWKV